MSKRFLALGVLVLLAAGGMLRSKMLATVNAEPTDDVRVEQIDSPQFGLPDQTFQSVTFTTPITTSLVVVNDRGGTGHKSFLVSLLVASGGAVSFSQREGLADVTLPLTRPIPISGVRIRCDSFSNVHCQYTVTLVGKSRHEDKD